MEGAPSSSLEVAPPRVENASSGGRLAGLRLDRDGLPSLLLQTGVCLGLFVVLRPLVFRNATLPEQAYSGPLIAWMGLENTRLVGLLVVLGALPLLRWRDAAWSRMQAGQSIRLLVVFVAVVLAYAFASYDYNLYFDRWHALDRAMLVLWAGLVFLHPAFTAPFLLHAVMVVGQFQHPLGAYSWTDKLPLFHFLILFCGYASVNAVSRLDARVFLLLVLSAHASDYVIPALGKLDFAWMARNRLDNLWMASHANGWLPGLAPAAASRVAGLVAACNAPLLWATLASELMPLFFLVHRRLAIVGLLAATALHVGIFAASGIFFWKWILLNLGLVALLLGPDRERFASAFGARSRFFWLSLPLVLASPWLFHPVRLAWIDTPLNSMYELEAVTRDGSVLPVGRDFLSPYDLPFAQNRFHYLVDEPFVAMTYGATQDLALAQALQESRSVEETLALDRSLGRVHADLQRRARFDHFVRRSFAALERSGGKPRLALGAPHHIWTWADGAVYSGEPLERVRVRWRTTWYDGRVLHLLRDQVIREIALDPLELDR